jgi:uncharacterized metal-binding protein
MKERITILPCNGDSAAGKISWIATQEMVLAGEAGLCCSFQQLMVVLEASGRKASSFIIVDGCERRCLLRVCRI